MSLHLIVTVLCIAAIGSVYAVCAFQMLLALYRLLIEIRLTKQQLQKSEQEWARLWD